MYHLQKAPKSEEFIQSKSEVVPDHAMKPCGGVEIIVPIIFNFNM